MAIWPPRSGLTATLGDRHGLIDSSREGMQQSQVSSRVGHGPFQAREIDTWAGTPPHAESDISLTERWFLAHRRSTLSWAKSGESTWAVNGPCTNGEMGKQLGLDVAILTQSCPCYIRPPRRRPVSWPAQRVPFYDLAPSAPINLCAMQNSRPRLVSSPHHHNRATQL